MPDLIDHTHYVRDILAIVGDWYETVSSTYAEELGLHPAEVRQAVQWLGGMAKESIHEEDDHA
jgi:hypothetical protein